MSINLELIEDIRFLNPWLEDAYVLSVDADYINRLQQNLLLDPEWDSLGTILLGPRQAGKTTLGFYMAKQLIDKARFEHLLYVNCDYATIREQLTSATVLLQLMKEFDLTHPVILLDEVQRLTNPGLLLKSLLDLGKPIKVIASGSSQLEVKSQVQEYLTGRDFEALVLPFSRDEIGEHYHLEEQAIYGAYPKVVQSKYKEKMLTNLYNRYIEKDIIEILQLNRPDVLESLLGLVAHASGQLVNYQTLANDCGVSAPTVQSYLSILEKTYVLAKLKPFVGNKRKEITSRPIYYFLDNGFRNQALRHFQPLKGRSDQGLLIESLVFQELFKYRQQHFYDFDIYFWRTKSQAEVDFILYKNSEHFLPIEVKYSNMKQPQLTRSFRSFIEAYKPSYGIIMTRSLIDEIVVDSCHVFFVPVEQMHKMTQVIQKALGL